LIDRDLLTNLWKLIAKVIQR